MWIIGDGGFGRGFHQVKSGYEDGTLELRVAGHAQRAAERKGDPQRSWRPHVFCLLANETYRCRDYAGAFDEVGKTANCGRAERSDRNQKSYIDGIGGQQPPYLFAHRLQ